MPLTEEGFERFYYGLDLTGTAGLRVPLSREVPSAAVCYAELEELLVQINQQISNLRNESEQADANNLVNLQNADTEIIQMIESLRSGITGRITVAGIFEGPLAEVTPNIPGIDITSAADNPNGWFLLISPENSESGIYRIHAGTPVRVAGFTNAENFPAGYEYFVNSNNQHYVVKDDASPVSATNPAVGSVEIITWSRAESLVANNPLEKVANALNLKFNAEYFGVNAEGQLDLAVAFRQKVDEFGNRLDVAEADIDSLQANVRDLDTLITNTKTDVEDNAEGLASANTQIAALRQFDQSVETRVTSAESNIDRLGDNVNTLTQADAAQQVVIDRHTSEIAELGRNIQTNETSISNHGITLNNHSNAIDGLRSTQQTQGGLIEQQGIAQQSLATRVNAAEGAIRSNDSDIATLQSTDQDHTTRIEVVEREAATLAALRNQVSQHSTSIATANQNINTLTSQNATQDNRLTDAETTQQSIQTALTDATATIAAHGNAITSLEADVAVRTTEPQVNALLEAFLTSIRKTKVLDSSNSRYTVVEADGYMTTTFQVSSGFGTDNFRAYVHQPGSPNREYLINDIHTTGVDDVVIRLQAPQAVERIKVYFDRYPAPVGN